MKRNLEVQEAKIFEPRDTKKNAWSEKGCQLNKMPFIKKGIYTRNMPN